MKEKKIIDKLCLFIYKLYSRFIFMLGGKFYVYIYAISIVIMRSY